MSDLASVVLKKGSAKPLYAGHPWVFAGAVARTEGEPRAGDEVRVLDERHTIIGRGFISPTSAIAVRLLTRGDQPADAALLTQRVDAAIRLRRDILKLGADTTAYRLINSEGDGLPGLIVDVYGDVLAVQFGTAGMDFRRAMLLDLLVARLAPRAIVDRSDPRARKLEQLPPPLSELLHGTLPEGPLAVRECGLELLVDPRGQKTGQFLDQRENRARIAALAKDRDVLDLFCFSGGFALHAAKGGAKSIALVDRSADALELARRNLERNGIDDADLIEADWLEGLRHLRENKRTFDLAIVDPPKFARSQQQSIEALSGYRELNAQAVRALRPGGLLLTCSCSGTISETDFERAVAAGLSSAGRRATVLERRGPGPDHPTPPGFEQGRYLKALLIAVD